PPRRRDQARRARRRARPRGARARRGGAAPSSLRPRHGLTRHEIPVFINVRRNIDGVARRAAEGDKPGEAAEHQNERDNRQRGNTRQRPRLRVEHALAGRHEEEPVDHEWYEEQHEFHEEWANHGVYGPRVTHSLYDETDRGTATRRSRRPQLRSYYNS